MVVVMQCSQDSLCKAKVGDVAFVASPPSTLTGPAGENETESPLVRPELAPQMLAAHRDRGRRYVSVLPCQQYG